MMTIRIKDKQEKCGSLEEFIHLYHRGTPTKNHLIDWVCPNTLREGFELMKLGYRVETRPEIPLDYPVFKIGEKFTSDEGSYEVTHILTNYNWIAYFGRLSFYKTVPAEEVKLPFSEVKTKQIKVTLEGYQILENRLSDWNKV